MSNALDDPEYNRLVALSQQAKDAGHLEAALAYRFAAIKRGDELLGKPVFGPIADSLNALLAAAPKQGYEPT